MISCDQERLHWTMVDTLIADGDLVDGDPVTTAFRALPRGMFLPSTEPSLVYSGQAVPTRWNAEGTAISSSSEPGLMAAMLRQLSLKPGQRLLEIGTGTGYNAALMGHMVQPNGSVVSIDLDADITREASANLVRAQATGTTVLTADGWFGAADAAPFDRIIATVGTSALSPHWVEQLKPHGVMVVPLSLRPGIQASIAFTKIDDAMLVSSSCLPCGFMGLRGVGAPRSLYERAGGWLIATDGQVRSETVRRLVLDDAPRRTTVKPPPPGWFAAVTLTERDAVFAVNLAAAPPTTASGLVDTESHSLAWIEESSLGASLVAMGGTHAASRLKSALTGVRALDISDLQVRVTRHDRDSDDGKVLLVLQRGEFTLTLDRPTDVATEVGGDVT